MTVAPETLLETTCLESESDAKHVLYPFCSGSRLRCFRDEFPNDLFELDDAPGQRRVLPIAAFQFLGQLLIQPLNRRQRHAVGVHGRDVFVVGAETESRVEILRYGTDVVFGRTGFVIPSRDGQGHDLLENFTRLDAGEIFLRVAVADRIYRAGGGEIAGIVQAHQRHAAAGIGLAVVVRAALVPRKGATRAKTIGAKIHRKRLHADALGGTPKIKHLARLVAEEEGTGRHEGHVAAVGDAQAIG